MIGYTCKYTPIELLAGFQADTVLLNEEAQDFTYAEGCAHNNLCCHTKALLEACHSGRTDELILVNCCDSVRRAYDVLQDSGQLDFLFFLDLPHTDTLAARRQLERELRRLAEAYGAYSGRAFNFGQFQKAFQKRKALPEEPFIGILGARVPDGLYHQISSNISMPVADLTCAGNRELTPPKKTEMTFDEWISFYAESLLTQIPCMRMTQIEKRQTLLESQYMKGVIYHTVKFCDYYGFEYEELLKQDSIPMLKLESDFTPQTGGQISTRIDAFMEKLDKKKFKKLRDINKQGYVAGIDSGSTSTNVVVLDMSGKVCASAVVRTGAKAEIGAEQAFRQAMESLGISQKDIVYVIATGYGRDILSQGDESVTEITCHAKGAYYLNSDVRTIIDIGGQDSKAIRLEEDGRVKTFAMNDKCAAGTGRFLDMMAHTLGMDLSEMGAQGLKWKEDLTISSMCTVFAESEVVSLIANNKRSADIIHGLNKSVASKTAALVSRVGGENLYMMTGGVARNPGVVSALEEKLGAKLYISQEPELCGALGAALFALEAIR